jgi:Tfp pilus assembly protein PilZ
MQDKRRNKRYRVDHHEIDGKMTRADKVEVLDISSGGVGIKADSRLNIGKEYLITLGEKGNTACVKGIVVRAALTGSEVRSEGEQALIYTVGIMFKEDQAEKIACILRSFQEPEQAVPPTASDRRLGIRFRITASREQTLSYPAQFRVKVIGLGGMLIQSDAALKIDSRIPMELSLDADRTISFTGRVASCAKAGDRGQDFYEIGVEFLGLPEQDTALIKTFIEYLAASPGPDTV